MGKPRRGERRKSDGKYNGKFSEGASRVFEYTRPVFTTTKREKGSRTEEILTCGNGSPLGEKMADMNRDSRFMGLGSKGTKQI